MQETSIKLVENLQRFLIVQVFLKPMVGNQDFPQISLITLIGYSLRTGSISQRYIVSLRRDWLLSLKDKY